MARGMRTNIHNLVVERVNLLNEATGRNHTQGEVISAVAKYCSISEESVKYYKQNKGIPSLPVAIRIAGYFGKSVEDVFIIEDYDSATKNLGNSGSKVRDYNKDGCKVEGCEKDILAKGFCSRHYNQNRNGTLIK